MDKIIEKEDELFRLYKNKLNELLEEENEKEAKEIIRKMSILLNF